VVGAVRAPVEGVSRQRSSACDRGPRVGRGGIHVRLAAVRRDRRRDGRHDVVRRLGSVATAATEIRVYVGKRGGGGETRAGGCGVVSRSQNSRRTRGTRRESPFCVFCEFGVKRSYQIEE